MNDIYGQVEQMLSAMKAEQEQELGATNETVRQVGLLRADCEELLRQIA